MESSNLNPGKSPPVLNPPENEGNVVERAQIAPKKRRKRGKGKPLTHHKFGSVGGRPKQTTYKGEQSEGTSQGAGSSIEQFDASKDEESSATAPLANIEAPSNELDNLNLRSVPIATSSPFPTPKKTQENDDVPGPSAWSADDRPRVLSFSTHEKIQEMHDVLVPSTQSEGDESKKSSLPSCGEIQKSDDVHGSSLQTAENVVAAEISQVPGPSTESADFHSPPTEFADVCDRPCQGDSDTHSTGRVGAANEGFTCGIGAAGAQEADGGLSQQLINDTCEELRRRIHMPFLILPEENGINVLLLSRSIERSVQRRAFFSIDGQEEITVHAKTLPAEIVNDILEEDIYCVKGPLTEYRQKNFIQRVVTVVNRLRSYEVCVGVDDSKFKPLWEVELKNGDIDKNPYQEARYSTTFRPTVCEILVPTKRYTKRHCQACIRVKMNFSRKLPQHVTPDFSATTPNIYLDRSQLIAKVQKQQKELQYARAQIAKLKEEVNRAIERDGLNVDDDLHDDLCSILDSAKLSPVQALFFEQQLKAVSAKNVRRRRWHPTLIRFALLLKSTSTAAYRAVKDSGVIVLPSERTLYEYSHAVSPQAGITNAKLDRVCDRIVKLYPEAYQKYHVLLMDEIHINKKLVFLKSTGEMIGYINVSDAENELLHLEAELKGENVPDTPPLATKIQAYMIKGVASGIEELVGTFPTKDAFDSETLYDMTWEVIGALERSGIKVIAIVSDGSPVNRAFYAAHVPLTKSSGVIFDTVNLCAPSRPLYFFADVPHLLKTIRNCFYKSGSGPHCTRLLTLNNQVIVWQTIKNMYEEDKANTLRRCYKLNAENVYLNSFTVMKVNYAARVLSRTVALDLESRKWPGTSETVNFIRSVNEFFDMLNGASTGQGKRTANPNLEPYTDVNDERFEKLQDFLKYLKKWRQDVEGKEGFTEAEKAKMMLSQQTLEGIEMTVLAFTGAVRFLLSEGVTYINARVFCQDPLERYFGKQRQCGGGSRNPTVAQFLDNEVKIAVHRDVNVRKSNVLSKREGMEVSSEPLAKKKRPE